jgi:predicted NodU family carbamoyl transferase
MANVKVNQRIYELNSVEKIFVHQNMGDGGLSLGAALDCYADERSLSPTLLEDVLVERVDSRTNGSSSRLHHGSSTGHFT